MIIKPMKPELRQKQRKLLSEIKTLDLQMNKLSHLTRIPSDEIESEQQYREIREAERKEKDLTTQRKNLWKQLHKHRFENLEFFQFNPGKIILTCRCGMKIAKKRTWRIN